MSVVSIEVIKEDFDIQSVDAFRLCFSVGPRIILRHCAGDLRSRPMLANCCLAMEYAACDRRHDQPHCRCRMADCNSPLYSEVLVAPSKALEEAHHPSQCCFIGLAGVATMLAGLALHRCSHFLAAMLAWSAPHSPFYFCCGEPGVFGAVIAKAPQRHRFSICLRWPHRSWPQQRLARSATGTGVKWPLVPASSPGLRSNRRSQSAVFRPRDDRGTAPDARDPTCSTRSRKRRLSEPDKRSSGHGVRAMLGDGLVQAQNSGGARVALEVVEYVG